MKEWKKKEADGSETIYGREVGALMLFRSNDGGIVWTGPQYLSPPTGFDAWSNIEEVRFLRVDRSLYVLFGSIGRFHLARIDSTGWGPEHEVKMPAGVTSSGLSAVSEGRLHAGSRVPLFAATGRREIGIVSATFAADSVGVDSVLGAFAPKLHTTEVRLVRCGKRAVIICSGASESDPSQPVMYWGTVGVE